jgi:hypothetical protein
MANAYAFEPARVKYGDQFVRGFTTICARCGAKGEVPCNTSVVPLKTEPREATPEERRIISAKLDDVYDVKAGRYIAPWTDQAVATDLGVPRAWVSHVRALLYGEEASNPEIEAVLAEARDVLDRVKESSGKVAAAASQLAALKEDHAKLVTRAEMIERKIASIEKALH